MAQFKHKISGPCTEEQARKIVEILNENETMIERVWIEPKNMSPTFLSTIRKLISQNFYSTTKESQDRYIELLNQLYEEAEKIRIMPFTKIIWRGYKSDIENDSLYCLDNENVFQIYADLTNLSKLLDGWKVKTIYGEYLQNKKEIVTTKRIISTLPNDYFLSSVKVLLHPWIRTADHYCDYLESEASLWIGGGKIIIESEKELYKFRKRLDNLGIKLETAQDNELETKLID